MDNSNLERLRQLAARGALLALADYAKQDETFVPVKDPRTERWHARVDACEFELLLTGPKFWDVRQSVGGGGAIDLAIHLFDCTFKEAIRRIGTSGL